MSIPVTNGSGQSSVAAEVVGGLNYQQVEIYGAGGSSVLGINPDGSLRASIIGVQTTNVISSVATVIIGGSIAASFTPPANQSVSGTVQTDVRGSVATVIIGGSIAASFTPPANQSVSGTVLANQGTNPWVITGSVQGSFTPAGNQSVSGTVGASIVGQLPAGTAVLGSVAALQGTTPWIVNFQNSSIIAVQAGSVVSLSVGSVITVLQAASIVGTYAEDAASASGDKGFLVMGARNDTLASVTSTDGDYSSHVVGPAGELIAENAPLTKWIFGTANFSNGNTGASILVTSAQANSVFTYITGVQIANMGSASVLVTLASGGSTLGYSIAPAGGGSNIYYQNGIKTPQSFGFAASLSGIASVFVSAQGFIAKI